MEIRWQNWGPEVFLRAEREHKLILLDITAAWCHWCHVMDETGYGDPAIADIINRDFIPVRVDTDRQPEINERYNMGGWPSTAFLTYKGDVVTGATYLPPAQLKQVLTQIADLYREREDEVLTVSDQKGLEVEQIFYHPHEAGGQLDAGVIEHQYQYLRQEFDDVHGGFGREPKFPNTSALEFCLTHYYFTQDLPSRKMLELTLDIMGQREIFDHKEGGFFRYSTSRDWNIPHYEKLLEDNAKLIGIYLQAYNLLQEDEYADIAVKILEYVESYLLAGKGGFFASQDADAAYYQLPLEQRLEKQPPRVDTSIYASGNAAMVSAYLLAAAVLDKPRYRDYSLETLDILLRDYANPQGLFVHSQTALQCLLADQVYLLRAVTDAYEHTGENAYLEQARKMLDLLEVLFLDSASQSLLDRQGSPTDTGRLRYKYIPITENSIAARLLIKWGHLLDKPHYHTLAEGILGYFSGIYQKYASQTSEYPLALYNYLNPPIVISVNKTAALSVAPGAAAGCYPVIPGQISGGQAPALLKLIWKSYLPTGIIRYVETGPPVAICVGKTCYPPMETPANLRQTLERIRESSKPKLPLLG